MIVTIAVDSFKGSISSKDAGYAVKDGILDVFPDAKIYVHQIADGGEGTVDAIVSSTGGTIREITVPDPLMRPIKAGYGIVDKVAIIEIAAAAGITLISPEQRNPLFTSTYGVGEIIKDAVLSGVREFIIGLGGSATNDGGAGMLQALGFSLLDKNGKDIPLGAIGLSDLVSISTEKVIPELKECKFFIACDVKNPLCGENGASRVFAHQKGADEDSIKKMDLWLSHYADITKSKFPKADKHSFGAGAAGGLGFAFSAYLNATFKPGIDLIIEKTNLEEYIKNSDIVITGEGRLDSQSVMGKAPVGIAKIAKKYNKKVIAIAGCVTEDSDVLNEYGIDAFFPVIRTVTSLEEALDADNTKQNIKSTVTQIFRLIEKCEASDRPRKECKA